MARKAAGGGLVDTREVERNESGAPIHLGAPVTDDSADETPTSTRRSTAKKTNGAKKASKARKSAKR